MLLNLAVIEVFLKSPRTKIGGHHPLIVCRLEKHSLKVKAFLPLLGPIRQADTAFYLKVTHGIQ